MTSHPDETWNETVDFKRLFAILLRWTWLLIAGVVIGAGAAYLFSRNQTPVYEATTNILVTRNSQQTVADLTQSLNLTQLVETYVRMLSMDEFLGIVSQRVDYEVEAENVNVAALTNTQIIELRVQDVDPARAALITDTMVALLIEQNETLQASRYGDAEQSLDIQITETEAKIADFQGQLDEAKDNALVEQVAEAKTNIDATVEVINTTLFDLGRLDEMSWESARFYLNNAKYDLVEQQKLLDRQIADRGDLESKLTTDPLVQTDPDFAENLRSQMTKLDEKITETQQNIEETQGEIEFFTPLITEEGFDKVLVEKRNFLHTQQALLSSYQNVYTNLLSTEEVKRTTNEIDNLDKNLALYQEIYLNLLSSREQVKTERMQNTPTVEQVSPAKAGQDPVKPRTLLNTLLGGLAGLILSGSIVILRESTDDTIKSKEDVETLLETKVIGYIIEIANEGDDDGIYVARVPRSPVAEAFRSLRANLEFSGDAKPIKSILVTSSGPSEGKTTIAANLAAILTHSGKKVILVDADLRRPRVHRYTGVSNATGLSELVNAEEGEELFAYIQSPESIPELAVLPSGGLPPNPNELLASEKMRQLLQRFSDCYDYVVIDAPPMVVADPHVLSGLVDGVLLVMVPGKTRTDVIGAIREQMQKSRAYLLGVVLNRLKHRRQAGYAGYSYYQYPYYHSSDYYYSRNDEKVDARRRKKRSTGRRNEHNQRDTKTSMAHKDDGK